MAIDFDKIDRSVDLKGLQADVEDAKKNGGGDFPTIPAGKYEVKLDQGFRVSIRRGGIRFAHT